MLLRLLRTYLRRYRKLLALVLVFQTIQTLLGADLVDELWLKIFPVTIGSGRRLFAEGTRYAGFALVETSASPSGVIVAKYRRAGDVKAGSFALPESAH